MDIFASDTPRGAGYENISLSLGLCHGRGTQPGSTPNTHLDSVSIRIFGTSLCLFLGLFIIFGFLKFTFGPEGQISSKDSKQENPPQVPYLLPIIGNLISYLWDPVALASKIQ